MIAPKIDPAAGDDLVAAMDEQRGRGRPDKPPRQRNSGGSQSGKAFSGRSRVIVAAPACTRWSISS